MEILVVDVTMNAEGNELRVQTSSNNDTLSGFIFRLPNSNSDQNAQSFASLLEQLSSHDLIFRDAAVEFNVLRKLCDVNGCGELAEVVHSVTCLRSWAAEVADECSRTKAEKLLDASVRLTEGTDNSTATRIALLWESYQTLSDCSDN